MSDATLRTPTKRSIPRQNDARFDVPATSIHRVEADGVQVFYREAGDVTAPVVLLLHGFPSSSFMFRELIPRLANDYHVIAPDLPGFGFTEVSSERKYSYTFDQLALTIDAFTQALNRLPFGDGSSRTSHSNYFAEWERLRRRPWRCLGPDPEVLGRANSGKQGHTSPNSSDSGRNALAVYPRGDESGGCSA
jgi:hypothetical protein